MPAKPSFDFVGTGEVPADTRRWSRRDANSVVQMSIRMSIETYEKFRGHCDKERRTNGDMLEEMMKSHELRAIKEAPFVRD